MQNAKQNVPRKPASITGAFAAVAIVAVFGLGFGADTAPAAAAASTPFTAFVQAKGAEAIGVLSNASVPEADRRKQFSSIVLQTFDVSLVGQAVLGSYLAKASPDQLARFQAVFKDALAQIYIGRFFDYDGQSLQVKGSRQGDGGTTIVESSVATPTGSNVHNVDWVVSGTSGKERLIDVVVDGVSTNTTTQQDYDSVLRSANGNLDALTARLQAMVQ